MNKPTYYLWRTDFQTDEDFQKEKDIFCSLGFRVVTFHDGQSKNNIHDGLKAIVKNHYEDNNCF